MTLVSNLLLLCAMAPVASSFVNSPSSAFVPSHQVSVTDHSTSALFAVELEAEPEGGDELTALKTMPDCRMKKMKEVSVDGGDIEGPFYEFWMTAVADGELVKGIRTQILKDASKKANFPGFRKVR